MFKYLPIVFLVLLIAVSCRKSDVNAPDTPGDTVKVQQADIASVNGPTTASPNQEVSFHVAWPHTGAHHEFNSFKTDTINQHTAKIKLFVNASTCDNCYPDTSSHTSVYKFKAAAPGTYYLQFFGADSKRSIKDTLYVK